MKHTLKWLLMIGLALMLLACNIDDTREVAMYTYYLDSDQDGYGDPANVIKVEYAEPPVGYVENDDDCDDANAAINPDADEVCDEVDNNCNGETDEGVTFTYCADSDGDGYGNAGDTTQACSAPAGYVEDNADCDDTNAAINPGVAEIDDDIDNDCDGEIDEDIMTIPSPPANVSASDNDGYVSVTYNGETYQYTLPVQPLEDQNYANSPEPVVPARDDAEYTIDRRDTDYPVPFAEEPNTECKNWSDDMIVYCNRVP